MSKTVNLGGGQEKYKVVKICLYLRDQQCKTIIHTHTHTHIQPSTVWGIQSIIMQYGGVLGFPGGTSVKEPACQCKRCKRRGFGPWVGKISWRRKMSTHSSVLAWRIPWTEELGGLQSVHWVTTEATKHAHMVTYCNQTSHGDHFKPYINTKSLCCVTEIHILLWVNYTSKINSQKKRSDLWFTRSVKEGGIG